MAYIVRISAELLAQYILTNSNMAPSQRTAVAQVAQTMYNSQAPEDLKTWHATYRDPPRTNCPPPAGPPLSGPFKKFALQVCIDGNLKIMEIHFQRPPVEIISDGIYLILSVADSLEAARVPQTAIEVLTAACNVWANDDITAAHHVRQFGAENYFHKATVEGSDLIFQDAMQQLTQQFTWAAARGQGPFAAAAEGAQE